MKKVLWMIGLFFSCLLNWGCEHKALCYDHNHGTPVGVHVDWSHFTDEIPTGMTLVAYPKSGKAPIEKHSNNIEYAEIMLDEQEEYDILVYNQSPFEFSFIDFKGMEKFETAMVSTVRQETSWYTALEDESISAEPENFASAAVENVRPTIDLAVQPQSRVFTLNVTVHVEGIENLYSIRGSLDGLSDGCLISSGETSETKVTQLLEKWTMHVDRKGQKGTLNCIFKCFGLSEEKERKDLENVLKLSILLSDQKTVKDFEFKVGDRFVVESDLTMGISLEVGTDVDGGAVDLPYVKPKDGGGGFDVNVGDWGDVEVVDIPI